MELAGSSAEDSIAYLKVYTNRSANPFEEGWYRRNSSYSADSKGGPLSLTTWVGRPYLAKILRMALMVESAVVVLDGTNHFRPLRVGVDHVEVMFCLMGGKIYVNTLPWSCRPRPWKKR